jgi:DNA-binding NarL/FixJ family response regulator
MTGIFTNGDRMGVAVVDGDKEIRACFTDILEGSQNFKVSGSFPSGVAALAAIPQLRPNFVLTDVRLPDLNGIEITRKLMHLIPFLKIVIVTGNRNQRLVEACSQAGAAAYLLKPVVGQQLLTTLYFIAYSGKNTPAKPEEIGISALPEGLPQKYLPLSPRENEVLAGLAQGLLYKEVSHKLGISYGAVHKYQHRIYKKLRVSNRSEAIRIWFNCNPDPFQIHTGSDRVNSP